MEQQQHPDLELGDFVVLKRGPKAYKVATHWQIVDRNTGELHHHSVRIETYRRLKSGWYWDEIRSITLEEDDSKTSEITPLTTFLASIMSAHMPTDPGDYLVLPLRREGQQLSISGDNLSKVIELSQTAGSDVTSRILGWIGTSDNAQYVLERLEELGINKLRNLNTVLGVASLKSLLRELTDNLLNNDEEFWQTKLTENSYILSQVFAYPVIILKGKAYVGGKGIENTGGNVVDFLCANQLTRSALLIEIKTPVTKILGTPYRGDIINASVDLTGAVLQLANYKNSLLMECQSLSANSSEQFDVFDPPCLVIIGNAQQQLNNKLRQKSFELFRAGLRNVQVITFDELLKKLETLISILEGGAIS